MIDELRQRGITLAPKMLGIEEFVRYLADRPMYEGHVAQSRRPVSGAGSSACWGMEDVIGAPHFWEFALSMFPVAREYLGDGALLYSLNAFTTYPRSGPTQRDIQEFHRDADDSRFLVLFVYCSDVLIADDGAHQFVEGSHDGSEGRGTVSVTGPAGTAFLAVTAGLHRGIRPTQRPRTLAWARWGISDPPQSYGWDHLMPVATDRIPDGMDAAVRLVAKRA